MIHRALMKSLGAFLLTVSLILPAGAEMQRLVFQAEFQNGLDAATNGGGGKPLLMQGITNAAGPNGLPAVSIAKRGKLLYEGAGNAFVPAGSVSFWWRPDAKVLKIADTVLSISSFQRFYYSRWLQIFTESGRLKLTLYHGDGADAFSDEGLLPRLAAEKRKRTSYQLTTSKAALKPDQWHHITATWSFAEGVALYVDGKLAQHISQPWFYGGNINHLGLGMSGSGYSESSSARTPQSFADVRVYDSWLSEGQIASLAEGKNPELVDADIEPLLAQRAQRLGLRAEISLPKAEMTGPDGKFLWIRQIGVPEAKDVRRTTRSGLDGDLGRAWPLYQGYSNSGELLRLKLDKDEPFNTVQAFGAGPMQVSARDATDDGERSLLSLSSGDVQLFSEWFEPSMANADILVKRESGVLFNLSVFNVTSKTSTFEQDGWKVTGLSQPASPVSDFPLIKQEFPPYDRETLVVGGSPSGDSATLRGMRAIHILGEPVDQEQGLAAIMLDLQLSGLPRASSWCVMLIDPVNYERRAAMVDFAIESNEANSRLRVVLDHRDLVYAKGARPWVVLYVKDEVAVALKDSKIGYQWVSVDTAKKEFFPDQLASVQDAFQELSESRPWGHNPDHIKWLRSMLQNIDVLKSLEPENKTVQGFWHWTHPKQKTPVVEMATPPAGVPPWAFYTQQSMELFRDVAYWWIDNRQAENGEFGAPDGINDDTDLAQDWLAVDLMLGPDPKIRQAVEKVAEISWHTKTIDGLSIQTTDTLHMYEWGINQQALAFVMNYGDPVYFERLLKFSKHYDKLMTEMPDGSLHFKTWFFGAKQIVTEGVYGRDILRNALLLQPAMLLGWYNGDPRSVDILSRWTSSMMNLIDAQASRTKKVPGVSFDPATAQALPEDTFGIGFSNALWASYKLTGKIEYRNFHGEMINYEITRKPLQKIHSTTSTLSAYLNATGDSRWDSHWMEQAGSPTLWERSLHNNHYLALEYFYASWLRSGDIQWVNDGSKLAYYHLLWSMPMLTIAEATTDRVWMPQRLANHVTLGDLTLLRNEIYPKQSVSWENASGKIAPLVRRHSDNSLEVEIQNLEDREVNVNVRIWELEHGIYTVKTSAQSRAENSDPRITEKEAELVRYDTIALTVPASGVLNLEIQQKERQDNFKDRCDLALSHLDAEFHRGTNMLAVQIHNIGRRETGGFRAKAIRDGKVILEKKFPSLPPPKDFATAKARFEIPLKDAGLPIQVVVEPISASPEITVFNNVIKITPDKLPKH